MRVFFKNLGCKLNQAEVEGWAREFVAAGHTLTSDPTECDVHIVNSCTVTHVAARDSRKAVRRAKRKSSSARTVLTGCYASDPSGEAALLAGVDVLIGNDSKHKLVETVEQSFPELRTTPSAASLPSGYVPFEWGRSRAMLKVEDGCNMHCAFCIIPSTRGRQRSRSIEDVVREARLLEGTGFREIVITGVQISEYRDGKNRLFELATSLLERTRRARFRLSSIAPWRFDRRLIELFHNPRLCRHVHLSLQSGCAATLERMRRPYSPDSFRDLVDELRTRIPGLAVTTDVIVGFPGEDDDEFEESLSFVTSLDFSRPHVFPYSARSGTPAAELGGEISAAVKKTRAQRMRAAGISSDERFRQRLLSQELEVLWEHRKHGEWHGLSDNYVRVSSSTSVASVGRLGRVFVTEIAQAGVRGRTCQVPSTP